MKTLSTTNFSTVIVDDLANVTGGAPCQDGYQQIGDSAWCRPSDPSGPIMPVGNYTPGEFRQDGSRRRPRQ